MKNIIFLSSIILILIGCSLPQMNTENFEGKFTYSISSVANTPDPMDSINYQVVYAKDSMLRIESFTPIGKQVYIKHIPRNRAYILMDLGSEKVAIQTIPDTLNEVRYLYSYKGGKKKFDQIKANNIEVTDLSLDTTLIMNYYPEISPKYSTALDGIPGLPVNYYLHSDGIWINYKLINLEARPVNINLFGIPREYSIITLDEFIERLQD